jgi:hypothetical protein
MIKVHFRKKTLLGYILYIPTVLNRAGSAFRTLADLRGIVLSVGNCGDLWRLLEGRQHLRHTLRP